MLDQLKENFGNNAKMYEIIGEIAKSKSKEAVRTTNTEDLSWDTSKFGSGIIIS